MNTWKIYCVSIIMLMWVLKIYFENIGEKTKVSESGDAVDRKSEIFGKDIEILDIWYGPTGGKSRLGLTNLGANYLDKFSL